MKSGIVKTLAFVLRRMDYGETSRIVTLFCREEGKVSVLAKGARARRNRFGAALELGALSTVVFYYKPSRELQTLTQADVHTRFPGMARSLESIYAGMHVLDVAHTATQAGEGHQDLFEEIRSVFKAIDHDSGNLELLTLAFRLRVSQLAGFAPSLSLCARCGRPAGTDEKSSTFDVRQGGVLCNACSSRSRYPAEGNTPGIIISQRGIRLMKALLDDPYGTAMDAKVSESVRNELASIMRLYERHHVFHGRTLRSESLVQTFVR